MTITTKFSLGDRVTWFSDDVGRQLTGTVYVIVAEADQDQTTIDYTIHCEEEIKSSHRHFISENDASAKLSAV